MGDRLTPAERRIWLAGFAVGANQAMLEACKVARRAGGDPMDVATAVMFRIVQIASGEDEVDDADGEGRVACPVCLDRMTEAER